MVGVVVMTRLAVRRSLRCIMMVAEVGCKRVAPG
jgi:hypothetical protein